MKVEVNMCDYRGCGSTTPLIPITSRDGRHHLCAEHVIALINKLLDPESTVLVPHSKIAEPLICGFCGEDYTNRRVGILIPTASEEKLRICTACLLTAGRNIRTLHVVLDC